MAARRVNWWVRYNWKRRAWSIYEGRYLRGNMLYRRKAEAVKVAAFNCRERLKWHYQRSELMVLDRRGIIVERRTYGKDPRRSKG